MTRNNLSKFLSTLFMLGLLGVAPITGCTGEDDDDQTAASSPTGDDDATTGDDDATTGDDDATTGDDDATSGDDDATSGDDDATSHGDDDATSGDDDATSHGDDDATAHGDDDATAHGDDDATAHGDDDATDHGDDDATAHGDDDATAHGDDDATAHGDDDATSAGDDDATSAGDDDATSTGDDDATSAGDDDATSTGDDDTTSAGDDDATSAGDDDTTTAGDDDATTEPDTDGDGVADSDDNCPAISNADQGDLDNDGTGDACDACPVADVPDGDDCPVTIYDVKDGTIPLDAQVSLEGALVTGRNNSSFFLQVKVTDEEYAGPDYSGISVYSPGNTVLVGDRVTLTGAIVADYYGQIELTDALVEVDASLGEAPPDPIVAEPEDVTTGGSRADALEAVIVQVQDVTVTDTSPDSSATNEFVVDDTLRVNDYLYLADPFPVEGQRYDSITGILQLRNNNFKLEPRDADDLVAFDEPYLTSIDPPAVSVAPNGSVELTVELAAAAPAGGVEVTLSVDPADAGTVPSSVTVAEGELSATFTYTDSGVYTSATVTATVAAGSVSATVLVIDPAAGHLVINEVDYDQSGTDTAEFVELYNGTDEAIDLTDLALVLVNGSGGAEYARVALATDTVTSLEAGEYLVIGADTVTVPDGVTVIPYSSGVQNGAPDGVAIVRVSTGDIIDALSYEGSITEAQIKVGDTTVTRSLVEGTPVTELDAGSSTPQSLIRLPNGTDTDDADTDWTDTATLTPGAENVKS